MKSDTQENQIIRKLPPLNVDQKKLDEKLQKNLVIYLIFLGIFAGIIAIVSFFIVFPAGVLDDYSLHRPYEIPSLNLFTMALIFF
jgi:hypothetical protein